MTESISNAIDMLLDRPKWSRKEYAFYQMLVDKVQKYRPVSVSRPDNTRPELVPIKDTSTDIRDINNNIQAQPWFKNSNNQGTITNMFNGMKIIDCKHRSKPYQYRLELLLNGNIHFVINVRQMPNKSGAAGLSYAFRVCYMRNNTKAHIAAFTPGHSKGHALPEYEYLVKMFPILEKHEIVCLAIELVAYYDVDNIMMSLPIGNKYPVTLEQLVNGVNSRWL